MRQMIEATFQTNDWHGCYDGGWGDLLVPEAFAHPAKFSRALIMRIIDHGLKQGYWKPGDTIGDPFGGVTLGGIAAGYRGLNWLGCELEARFVDLGNQNLRKHAAAFKQCGATMVKLVQGDSRRFAEIVAGELDAVCTSPPFQETLSLDRPNPAERRKAAREAGIRNTEHVSPIDMERLGKRHEGDYGTTPGNIGNLPAGDLAAVVTSPPFTTDQPCASQTKALKDYHAFTRGDGTKRDQGMQTDGNIAGLPSGSLDACLTSPPYANSMESGDKKAHVDFSKSFDGKDHRGKGQGCQGTRSESYSQDTPGQIGALKEGTLDAAVTSPPWENKRAAEQEYDEKYDRFSGRKTSGGRLGQSADADYGQSEGQLGNMKGGFEDLPRCSRCGKLLLDSQPQQSDENTAPGGVSGQSARLTVQPSGAAHAREVPNEDVVGMDRRILRGGRLRDVVRGEQSPRGTGSGGDNRPSQEGTPGCDSEVFAVAGIPWSPPVPEKVPGAEPIGLLDFPTDTQSGKPTLPDEVDSVPLPKKRKGKRGSAKATRAKKNTVPSGEGQGNNSSPLCEECGREGNRQGDGDRGRRGASDRQEPDSYWKACAEVYRQVRLALRPNGIFVVVVKAYVSKGKIVDLPSQTCDLLSALGFDVFEVTRAWLTKEERHPGLFGEEVVKKTKRVSFFRRLHEKKRPDLAIDYECVVWARKALFDGPKANGHKPNRVPLERGNQPSEPSVFREDDRMTHAETCPACKGTGQVNSLTWAWAWAWSHAYRIPPWQRQMWYELGCSGRRVGSPSPRTRVSLQKPYPGFVLAYLASLRSPS